jgi:hypothetical protein
MFRAPLVILATFSILYLILIQYCRTANYRDPTSKFFDPARAYKHIYSQARIKEADLFILSQQPRPTAIVNSALTPVLCIGVATVARRGDQYVRRTIGSLLEGLSEQERGAIYLNLFLAHTDHIKHPVFGEKRIETLPNKVLEYRKSDIGRVQEWETNGWYRNKTIFDYTYLLQDCYATGAPYITMIEDDTLAVRGWYPRALEALRDVRLAMEGREGEKWVYLRLFYTEDLFGWNSESWPRYLFWSLTIWLAVMSCTLVLRSRSRWLQVYISGTTVLVTFAICVPALIGLAFATGYNSISPLSPGVHEMNKFGCCSQGYIYPREIVQPLLQSTNLETDWLVDMMVEDIANEKGWIRWAQVPALLQHIGSRSSKGYGFDDTAKHLWNFRFELYQGLD